MEPWENQAAQMPPLLGGRFLALEHQPLAFCTPSSMSHNQVLSGSADTLKVPCLSGELVSSESVSSSEFAVPELFVFQIPAGKLEQVDVSA